MAEQQWLHSRAAAKLTKLSSEQLRECVELGLICDYIQTLSGKRRYHIADLQHLAERYRAHHARVQEFENYIEAETRPLFDRLAEIQQMKRQLLIRRLSR